MAKMQVFTYDNLLLYDELLKSYVDAEDAKSLKTVAIEGNTLKFYKVAEPVGDTEPAYTITLPETDLSGLIPKITGATVGNVVTAKADGTVEDSGIAIANLASKSEVEVVDDKADANTSAIEAINNGTTGILAQAKTYADGKDTSIQAAKDAADAAQADVDTLETKVGDISTLTTTAKTNVVSAINEIKAAVAAGGEAGVITIDTTTTTEGYLKSYTINQGGVKVGTIDIPKDLVVTEGSVVVDPEGQPSGTYIKLVIANQTDPIYINVGTLVDLYTEEANATQIQLTVDNTTREISAVIVAGSVGTTELADNAVTTIKIADANVTKAKLHTDVQTSLGKADSAIQSVITGTANGTISVDGTDVSVKGLGSAAYTDTTAYDAAGVAETKVNALANGAVATNTANITTLQGLVGDGCEAIPEASITALFD